MPRTISIAAALFTLLVSAPAQRSSSSGATVPTTLHIRVVTERGPAAGPGLRVQLLNERGGMADEYFTNQQGEVDFRVFAGDYRVRVTGPPLVEMPDTRMTIYPREASRSEFVTVRYKDTSEPTSPQGHISAAALNIPDKARQEFDRGLRDLQQMNFGEAKKHFQKAADIYPRYADAFNALGVIAMKGNEAEQGRKLFETAIRVDEEQPGAYVNLARIYMREQKFADGETLLLRSTKLAPMDAEALSMLSFFQLNLGKDTAAIATARKVHQLPHERFAMVHYVAASAFEKENQWKQAIQEYKLFIQESPAGLYTERAKAQVQTLEARLR